jgi:hypothetical protein
MRAALTSLGLGLWVMAAVPPPLAAQEGASAAIDGFNEMPWGASRADIEAHEGTPSHVDSLASGILVLAYQDSILGRPGTTLYAVLPDKGLVKGQHLVELDLDAGECVDQYREYRDHITLRYPLIRPVENVDFPSDQSFCEAVGNGVGTWATQWTDRTAVAVVTVIVERGTTAVKLIFESGAFLDWLGLELPPEVDES